jgi:hypothetical protein
MAIIKRMSLGVGRRIGWVEPLSGHYWWGPENEV